MIKGAICKYLKENGPSTLLELENAISGNFPYSNIIHELNVLVDEGIIKSLTIFEALDFDFPDSQIRFVLNS